VAARIAALRDRIKNTAEQAPGLKDLLDGFERQLADLRGQLDRSPEVSISLIGGTGAGKSTLLNALVGARLLPVSNMRACTAAVSEVAWSEDGSFKAEVEFVPRSSWIKEVEQLRQDIEDHEIAAREADHHDGHSKTGPMHVKAARDKLRAVYGHPDSSDGAGQLDLSHLVEPDDIRAALDAGVRSFDAPDIKTFESQIKLYLNSEDRFWPIVKRVRLWGPFKPLRNGVRLVDLPGLNDPNEAREQVTKEHIKTCRFVWIVFNIKRVLTKNDIEILSSPDFIRQVVMDGRANALTLVATASDDIDLDSAMQEFKLDAEAEERDAILARNSRIRQVISGQLEELADRFAGIAGEQARAGELRRAFHESRVFTTSAQEYLKCLGLSKSKHRKLETAEETELPALLSHMDAVSAGFGVEAHVASIARRVALVHQQVQEELKARRVALAQLRHTTEVQRKEVKRASKEAHRFLEEKSKALGSVLAAKLDGEQKLLRQRFETATVYARQNLASTVGRWNGMHWATLRAVARRGGAFAGSTGKHDFPEDVCRPILNAIAFAWADFFGQKMSDTCESSMHDLLHAAQDFKARLLGDLAKIPNMPSAVHEALDDLLATTERILTEQLGQIRSEVDTRIQSDRRTLYEGITREVGANMAGAFAEAAEERGAGMKQRMVETIGSSAKTISEELLTSAVDQVFAGVRSLTDWLGRKHAEMAETVVRHGALAETKLTQLEDLGAQARLEREVMLLERLRIEAES
jgi:energy-coupling factor transporter ATP-binding protein EcfA2